MEKKTFLLSTLCLLAQWNVTQALKWVEKAKRAIFSMVTYGENDKVLSTGNGPFVIEDDIALSNYSLFKGVQRAVVVNSVGVQMLVVSILGANDMYDVIKSRADISVKKVPVLNLAAVSPAVGANVYILPYSTQRDRSYTAGQMKAANKFSEKCYYYTPNLSPKDKTVSCPVVTEEGEVFALAQRSSGVDTTTICHAADANSAMAQSVSALSFGDMTLKNIGIKKALPDTEEEALVLLFMVLLQVSQDEYAQPLDDLIAEYPNSADGYMRCATNQLYRSKGDASMEKVEADMDKALSVAQKKDSVYYNRTKLIYSYILNSPEKSYKDWFYDRVADEIREAIVLQELPVYVQIEGDTLSAKQDHPAALAFYEKVNQSDLVSAMTFFSAAKTKELMKTPAEEVLALMDSCMTHFNEPYTEEAVPHLLECAQIRMNADQARATAPDYDAHYKTVNGKINDVFYYYREQAALKAKQFQRVLNDLEKAIELGPKGLTHCAELVVVNIRVGRNEEALKILQDASTIDPKYAEAYRLMGIVQLQMKKKQEACQNFAKAKDLGDLNVDELIEKHCK